MASKQPAPGGSQLVTVTASLLSGRTEKLRVDLNDKVGVLIGLAREALRCCVTDLVASDGHQLTGRSSLDQEGLKDGDALVARRQASHLVNRPGLRSCAW